MFSALISIAVLHWAVLVIPGFNFVLIGQLAAGGSRSAAMSAVAGMTSATLVWASLAVAGIGIVFTAHPALRVAAQVIGGSYLLHLAIKLWRAGRMADAAVAPVLGGVAAFRTGFMTSALNPKIALFYGSVFATALPAEPQFSLAALAVALVFANSLIWHASLALVLSRVGVRRAYMRHCQAFNRASAGLVGLFGARLVALSLAELRSRAA